MNIIYRALRQYRNHRINRAELAAIVEWHSSFSIREVLHLDRN